MKKVIVALIVGAILFIGFKSSETLCYFTVEQQGEAHVMVSDFNYASEHDQQQMEFRPSEKPYDIEFTVKDLNEENVSQDLKTSLQIQVREGESGKQGLFDNFNRTPIKFYLQHEDKEYMVGEIVTSQQGDHYIEFPELTNLWVQQINGEPERKENEHFTLRMRWPLSPNKPHYNGRRGSIEVTVIAKQNIDTDREPVVFPKEGEVKP